MELAVPTDNQQTEVTIITTGKGYQHVVAFRIEANNFHEKIENGTISDLQIAPVELDTDASLTQHNANSTTIQLE